MVLADSDDRTGPALQSLRKPHSFKERSAHQWHRLHSASALSTAVATHPRVSMLLDSKGWCYTKHTRRTKKPEWELQQHAQQSAGSSGQRHQARKRSRRHSNQKGRSYTVTSKFLFIKESQVHHGTSSHCLDLATIACEMATQTFKNNSDCHRIKHSAEALIYESLWQSIKVHIRLTAPAVYKVSQPVPPKGNQS